MDGSDSNTGDENNPYQTISKAYSSVTASDNAIIHLGEGTFNPPSSYLNINLNHVAQNTSLTFVGAGFNKTIIESSSTNFFTQIGNNAIVSFVNITFTNFKPSSQASVIYSQGTLTVDNCIFENNGATNSYGAIYFSGSNRNLTVKNSIFNSNIARTSTADIWAANGNITLFNNHFSNPKISSPNSRNTRGYSVYASTSYFVNITGNTFENIASPNLYDAGLYCQATSVESNIIGNTFINCSATSYAVIYLTGNNYLEKNRFINSSHATNGNIYNTGKINAIVSVLDNKTVNTIKPTLEIYAHVTDDNNNTITGGQVTFTVNGATGSTGTVTNGKAAYIASLDNGKYNINATYSYASPSSVSLPGVLIVNVVSQPLDLWVSDSRGNDENDGSKNNPFKTIKKAAEYGLDHSANVIVHIEEGTYKGLNNTNINYEFSNLTLIGDYGKTIIDGQESGLLFADIGKLSYTKLINLTFKNFNGNPASVIQTAGDLDIDKCIFTNNRGTGSYGVISSIQGKYFALNNSIFTNNSAVNYGGDVYIYYTTNVTINNNNFTNSTLKGSDTRGSSVYVMGSAEFNVTNNRFSNITSTETAWDAGLFANGQYNNIINNTFTNCNNTGVSKAILYINSYNFLENNKFINSTNPYTGNIYSEGNMNMHIKVLDNTTLITNSTTFTLYANCTDDQGNTITQYQYQNIIQFSIDGEILKEYKRPENGIVTYTVSKLISNGNHIVSAINSREYKNTTVYTGILKAEINYNPVELWVDNEGDDSHTGEKTSPFKTIQHAIEQGLKKSANVTIHINEGNYNGVGNTNLNISSYAYVTLIGQYNKTIINGDDTNTIFSKLEYLSLSLNNLTFINAKSTSQAPIIHSTNTNEVYIDSCIFENNTGYDSNGNIYLNSLSVLKVNNSYFINNNYTDIYASTSSANVTNNHFIKNSTHNSRFASQVLQLFASNANQKFEVINNTFNIILTATYSTSTNVYLVYSTTSTQVINNTFINCSTPKGFSNFAPIGVSGISYVEGNVFENCSNSTILTMGRINANITILENKTLDIANPVLTIKATITDDMGNPISANGNLNFFLNNGTSLGSIKVSNGEASITYNDFWTDGTYIIGGNFTSDSNLSIINTATLNVKINNNITEIWVNDLTGNDNNDGSSSNPFKTIKKAIDHGFSKSMNVVIHVAEGNYTGENNLNCSYDYIGNLTIKGNSYNKSMIDGSNLNYFIRTPNIDLTLENITLLNTYANSEWDYPIRANSIMIQDSIFENIGKGTVSSLSNMILDNIIVTKSATTFSSTNNLSATNIHFNDNTGGGLSSKNVSVYNSEFTNNKRSSRGGYVIQACNLTSVNNNYSFNNNYQNIIYSHDGAITSINDTFINNTNLSSLLKNEARPLNATFINDKFINNSAYCTSYYDYTGILMLYSNALIDNCSFINNTFYNTKFRNSSSPIPAAIICKYNSNVTIYDNTIFENNKCLNNSAVADITIQDNGVLNNLTFNFCSLNVTSYSSNLSANVSHPTGARIFAYGRDDARVSLYLKDLIGEIYSLGNNFKIYDNNIVTSNGGNLSYDAFVSGRYTFYGDFESAGEDSIFNEGTIIVTRDMVPYVDLYVSSIRGSDDSGDGSFTNPFYTLRKALNYAYEHTDNITIHLLEGNYSGSDNLGLSLSTFMNITIIGEGADKTILGGSDIPVYLYVTRGNRGVTLENLSFINKYNTTPSSVISMQEGSGSLTLNNILFSVNGSSSSPEGFNGLSIRGGDLFVNNVTLIDSNLNYLFYARASSSHKIEIFNSNFYNSLGSVIGVDPDFAVVVDNCNFINVSGHTVNSRVSGSDSSLFTAFISNSNFTNCGGISGASLINNCNFINAGIVSSSQSIMYSNFTNNTHGAIRSMRGTTIDHCIFIGNSNDMGGAIVNRGDDFLIKDSVFINNSATYEGGAIGFSHPGWGLYVNYGNIINSTFINNSANNGGVFGLNFGTAVGGGRINVTDCDFINNYAETSGGAINIPRIDIVVTDSNFVDNHADSSGGAIYGKVDCFSVKFINNTADFMGGALNGGGTLFNCILENNTAPYMGGAIYTTSTLNLTYSAIVGSDSLIGPAIFISSSNNDGDLSFNWWGSNDNPDSLVYNSPGVYKWAVLDVSPDKIPVGDNVTVNLVFKDNDGYVLNGYIPVRVANIEAIDVNLSDDSVPIAQNSGSFTAASEDSLGSVLITVDNQTILLGVKHDSRVVGSDLIVNYGDNIRYNVTILSGSVPIANATVNLVVDEKLYSNVSDENGRVNFIIDNLAVGNYSLVYQYMGSELYSNSSNTSLLTVNKANLSLSFDLDGLVYGDDLVVTANVNDASGKIIISIDGDVKSVDIVNGSASAAFSGLSVGEHVVHAYYAGDDNYNDGLFNQSFNITQYPSTLNITVEDIEYGSDLIVIGFVDVDATGNVTFTIDGVSKTANIVYGSAQVIFSNLKAGNYTVVGRYNGDLDFAPSVSNASFEVSGDIPKGDSVVIRADNLTKYYGNNKSLEFTLTDDKGNVLSDKSLIITINGKNYTRTTNANGVAVMKIDLAPGKYDVIATFNGDEKFAQASSNVTANILTTVISKDMEKYYKNATQFYATLVDSEGNILSDTTITFNINGRLYERKTNENGSARMNINLIQGTYIISAYNPVTNETNSFNIKVLPLIVDNSDLTKYFRNSSQYVVRILDNQGNSVGAGEKVTFNINGVFYERSTNASGYAKMNINLPPGDYIITATYNGESVSNNIKVLPTLKADNLTKYFRNSSQYVVRILDNQGNSVGAGEKVTFNINGVFYERSTNASGYAKMNINLPPGDYIITATYNGESVSNNIKVLPTLKADNLTKKYGGDEKFNVTLLDGQGNPVGAGEKVTFNINGVFYNRTTDSNGVARLNIRLPAGEYIITSYYESAVISNKVTVVN